jgi:Uri superfamily endonuclease
LTSRLGRSLRAAGTYALVLENPVVARLRVGCLGLVSFEAPVYLYVGSAFGPGGLSARLRHHLDPAKRPHWHIDYLRGGASLAEIWTTSDARRLECAWSEAARSLRGARGVVGFGATDCRCESHLVGLAARPRPAAFRRHLRSLVPRCDPICVLRLDADSLSATDWQGWLSVGL